MKKLLYILIPLLILFSCEKNNNDKNNRIDEQIKVDSIFAGGLYVNVADMDSNYIRLFTDTVLSDIRIKSIISDLMNDYEDIYFGTTSKHNKGEDYASWTGERFFDYTNGRIISKRNFFKQEKQEERDKTQELNENRNKPKKRKNLDSPV